MTEIMPIYFYSSSKEYFAFSNFAHAPFIYDGKQYETVEAFFQSMKFTDTYPAYAERIRKASSPGQAKRLGGDRNYPIRPDWNKVRLDVMWAAISCKFRQNEHLKEVLLSTSERQLCENSPGDTFWGIGKFRDGENHLGQLLMKLRQLLREEDEHNAGS